MGQAIEQEQFEPRDHERFSARLQESLTALREVLARPAFGVGPRSLGAELEMFLVDDEGKAVSRSVQVRRKAADPKVTLELDRFNLEVNAEPLPLAGRPFQTLSADLEQLLGKVRAAAHAEKSQVALIGILPTLTRGRLGPDEMTRKSRYRALNAGILASRKCPLRVDIDGPEPLQFDWDEVTLQGANTSFQVHLRVDPADFARTYNAAQLALAPALAMSGNSPFFLGHSLWEETRIPLFEQSVDDRDPRAPSWRPPRASFGHGWVRDGAYELFAEGVALHAPLLPVCSEESPVIAARDGQVPALEELRLHNGTVWTWSRAVYDPADGGHVRMELRPFPSGPTVQDMLATSAFVLGLTLALSEETEWMLPAVPFELAKRNFFDAARRGLSAELLWADGKAPSPRARGPVELVESLLPVAEKGLLSHGVDASDISSLLGLVSNRIARGMTGARWQREAVAVFEKTCERKEALARMLHEYQLRSTSGAPAHEWPLP